MKKTLLVSFLLVGWAMTGQLERQIPSHIPAKDGRIHLLLQEEFHARPSENQYFLEDFNNGIPSTWTVTDNAGTGAVWEAVEDYYGNTLDGTPFVIADSDGAGEVEMDTYLESPVININNNNATVFLGFDFIFTSYSGNEKGDVEVFDGSNWILLARYQDQDFGSWEVPDTAMLNVTPYLNPSFKVRFHYYDANFDWYWALDNVRLYTPPANDLAMAEWAIPFTAIMNEETYFSTLIINLGYQTQDVFEVTVEVIDNLDQIVFQDNVSFTEGNLELHEKLKVNFPQTWTPQSEGDYTVRYSVILSGDEDPANNTYEIPLIVKNFTYETEKIYSFIAYDADNSGNENYLGYFHPENGQFTEIDSVNGLIGNFFIAGDFADIFSRPVLVASDLYNILYFINGDGQAYPYGYDPFLEEVITGIAFRQNGQSYYSTLTSLYKLTPYLDTVKIGSYNLTSPYMIGIAMDSVGTIYGIDLGTDSLYIINPETAQLTPIGYLGMDLNYIQDIGFDKENNILYGTLFGTQDSVYVSGLYTVDLETGQANLIGSLQEDEYSICAYSPAADLHTEFIFLQNWNIYPVPAKDILYMRLPDKFAEWEIFDTTGKILMKGKIKSREEKILIGTLIPGAYWIRIRNDNNSLIRPFIKK